MSFVVEVHKALQNLFTRGNNLRSINSFRNGLNQLMERVEEVSVDLFTDNSKVRLENSLHLSYDIDKRSTVHVFEHKGEGSIVIERMVTDNNMWTLRRRLVYFELLDNLLADFFLYVHLYDL